MPTRCPTSTSTRTTCGAATPRRVGPIDEEQRYYLETRGIDPAVAERLIVLGFFSDLAGRAPFPGVGRWVEDAVRRRMAGRLSAPGRANG